jgi:hypothetical protein
MAVACASETLAKQPTAKDKEPQADTTLTMDHC